MRSAVIVGASLVAALIAGASSATSAASVIRTIATDPRDSGGRLDLRDARIVVGASMCRATISTWGGWRQETLQGSPYAPGRNKLGVVFDVNGDNEVDLAEYFIRVGTSSISLWIKSSTGNFRDVAAVVRLNASSVTAPLCKFLYDLQGTLPKTLRVAFTSVYRTHHDRMPNSGWIRLQNPLNP
jgi:hypothetical protein